MKKFLAIVTIFIVTVGTSHSQSTYQIKEAMDFFRTNRMQTGGWRSDLTEDNIKGSPYLNDEFINGTIYTTSKLQYVNIPLRYNIYNDDMEFKSPDESVLAMAAPEIVEKAEFGDYKMAYIPFANAKKIRNGFFIILEEGKASLYERARVLFKEPEEPGAYKEAEPAKFVRKANTYYVRIGKEQAQLVSSKKELLSVFPDHSDEIATFIKKNKVKPSKPETLIKLVQYYNTL